MKFHANEKTGYSPHETEQSLLLTPPPKIKGATPYPLQNGFQFSGPGGLKAFATFTKTSLYKWEKYYKHLKHSS